MTATFERRTSRTSLTAIASVSVLVCANAVLAPERILLWVVTGMLVPAMSFRLARDDARHAAGVVSRGEVMLTHEAILGAGIVLSASLLLVLLRALRVDLPDVTPRVMGVLTGAGLVGIGNTIPKALPRWRDDVARVARAQARQRFAGWTFTVAGLAIIGSWLLLPEPLANQVALVLCGTAVLLITTRTCTPRTSRRPAS